MEGYGGKEKLRSSRLAWDRYYRDALCLPKEKKKGMGCTLGGGRRIENSRLAWVTEDPDSTQTTKAKFLGQIQGQSYEMQ